MTDVQVPASNPFLPEFLSDVYTHLARLRESTPVTCIVQPNGLATWFVTRHADALAMLVDRRLSKDPAHAAEALNNAGVILGQGELREAASLLTSDPPVHTRLRRLVSAAFTPRRVERLRPFVQRIAEDLLTVLVPRGRFDLLADYAYPLPATVMAHLLGVPAGDRDSFRTWVGDMLTPANVPNAQAIREDASAAMRGYLADLVETKRRTGDRRAAEDQPDLASALVAARDADDRLTEPEVIRLLEELLIGGYETTANMIGNGALALLRNPTQRQLLRDHPEQLPDAIDELIRFDGSVTRATLRIATEDITLDDVTIPAGAAVSIVLGAANHDPAAFDDPDRLDVTRAGSQHLGLGHGVHYCLGAPLARLEGAIAFGTLLDRCPTLALACRPDEIRWRPLGVQRGIAALPVTP